MIGIGTKKLMIEVDYSEVEQIIQDTYGIKEYNLPCAEETGNDTALTYNISPEEANASTLESINKMRLDKCVSYKTLALMNDLCFKGLIEAGEYVIEICW